MCLSIVTFCLDLYALFVFVSICHTFFGDSYQMCCFLCKSFPLQFFEFPDFCTCCIPLLSIQFSGEFVDLILKKLFTSHFILNFLCKSWHFVFWQHGYLPFLNCLFCSFHAGSCLPPFFFHILLLSIRLASFFFL